MESTRLQDQARTLEALLHADTAYAAGSRVLEAGCGVGAQTLSLARNSPGAAFTALDIAPPSLATAEARVRAAGLTNVTFRQGDIAALPFAEGSFDHVFLCFVLEHLPQPVAALAALSRVLKPGGTLTVIEGDHGSVCFHPDSVAAQAAIRCQVALQRAAGGDALIGRRLRPLLASAGLRDVAVSPRLVYADAGRPDLVEGFIAKTFIAMVAGVGEAAVAAGLTSPDAFATGLKDLARTCEPDGVFCYTFFKATARKAD